IQKMRFDQRLEYEINCSVKGSIPPLIVQPLVENSIKYNIKEVDVLKIMIDVSRGKNIIVIKIIDSAKKVTPDMLHKGTGLTVTQKRVENAGGSFIIKNGGIEISF
ncbi:MAG: histidine kinase, partial [Desulfobacterales bacterium]|nr:histidine kinase [Desulfobacterales bacterium]